MIRNRFRFKTSSCDFEKEKQRYDNRAEDELKAINNQQSLQVSHSEFIAPIYDKWYELIDKLIKPGASVLEIGAGTGTHTKVILDTGAHVTAQDISEVSLKVLRTKLSGSIETIASNMESIPIKDCTFDFIVCCNVLSYGSPVAVNNEIYRLLKPGGGLLIMDSLNHNYIYRINRRIHYFRGNRTKSTLKRVPSIKRIQEFSKSFESNICFYFGSYYWIVIPLKFLLGQRIAFSFNKIFENTKPSGLSSFKFILVCEKYIN
jgi:ubiquinone/menaquinone biosynthesis C-methylase UbiE